MSIKAKYILSAVSQTEICRTVCRTNDPLVKGGRIAFQAIRGDSCRQYEFAENLAE